MSDEFISTLTLLKLPAMKNYYTRALLLEKYMTRNNCFLPHLSSDRKL